MQCNMHKLGANKGNAGKGRPKGSPNKITKELKTMILEALDGVGGVEYLQEQARESPNAFLSLVGKVLPLQVGGVDGAPIRQAIEVMIVDPKA